MKVSLERRIDSVAELLQTEDRVIGGLHSRPCIRLRLVQDVDVGTAVLDIAQGIDLDELADDLSSVIKYGVTKNEFRNT